MVFASAGRRGGSSNAAETVKLVFSASDQASAVVGAVAKSVGAIGTAANLSRGAVLQLGDTILSVFNNSFGIINNVLELFQRLNGIANSQVARQYFSELDASATKSLRSLASYETALTSINQLLSDGRAGAIRKAQEAEAAAAAESLANAKEIVNEYLEVQQAFADSELAPAYLRQVDEAVNALEKFKTEALETTVGTVAPEVAATQSPDQQEAGQKAGQQFAAGLESTTAAETSKIDPLGGFGKRAIASAQKVGQQSATSFVRLYQTGLGRSQSIGQGLDAAAQDAIQKAARAGAQAGEEFGKSYAAETANFAQLQFDKLAASNALVVSDSKNAGREAGASFAEGYDEAALAAETLAELKASEQIAIEDSSSAGIQAGQQFGQQYTAGVQATASAQTAIQTAGAQAAAAAAVQGSQAGQQFGVQYGDAAERSIGATLSGLELSISQFTAKSVKSLRGLERTSGGIAGGLFAAGGNVGEPLKILNAAEETVGGLADAFNQASFKIAFFYGSLQAMQQFVLSGPFQLLIQQNVELREQLLSTQSSLVSTNRVLQNGIEIGDPTQAIRALEAPVEAAITKIRKDSLELVGVTSNDLIGVFNILTGQISAMGGGLNDAADLTISLSAAMGTLSIPLDQARQEIVSIAQAQVTSDSVLAKSIGLTNEQLRLWKQQGTLIDNINTRLEAFRAGNALAAQTIGGITSNIQEVIQEVARVAGEPLVDPIVKQLGEDGLLGILQANQGAIADEVSLVANNLRLAGESIVRTFSAIVQSTGGILVSIPRFLSGSLVSIVKQLESAVKGTLAVLQPFINILTELAERAKGFNPVFRLVIIFGVFTKALTAATEAFQTFGASVPFVGEAMDYFSVRLNPLLNTFFNLSGAIGAGGASFLLLGKNLQSLPPVLNAVSNSLGIFGPVLTGIIPAISGFAIQVVALAPALAGLGISAGGIAVKGLNLLGDKIPGLNSGIQALTGAVLGLLRNTKLLEKFPLLEGFDDVLETAQEALIKTGRAGVGLGDAIQETVDKIDLQTFANEKAAAVAKTAGSAIAKQVTQYGLFGAGALLAVFAIDQLILKNEAVREAFIGVFNAAVSVGEAILNFVQNPVIAVAAAISGLVLLISSGLLPKWAEMAAQFAKTGAEKAAQGIELLQAQFGNLRQSVANTAQGFKQNAIQGAANQFSNLRENVATAAAEIKQVGLRNFITNLKNGQSGATGFSAGMQSLGNSFKTAAAAAKGFILAVGPIAVITVAVVALAEAWNTYNRIQKASEKATKDVTAALRDQLNARLALDKELAGVSGEDFEVDDDSIRKGRESVEATIQEERSALNKFLEGTLRSSSGALSKFFTAGLFESDLEGEARAAVRSQFNTAIAEAETGREKLALQLQKTFKVGFDFTGDEADAAIIGNTESLNVYSQEVKDAQANVDRLNSQYKSLVDQFNDGTISQEEFNKKSEILNKSFEQEAQSIEENRASLLGLAVGSKEAEQRQIELGQAFSEVQEALSQGREAELAQKELPRLGSAYDQLSQKVADAADYIKTGTGETEVFAQKIDDLLKNVPTLFEQGFVDEDAAIEALQAVANNVNATAEQQLAAQQEIDKILQSGGDSRVRQIQTEITRINGERAKGNLTDLEAEQQITQLKQQEYAARLDALKENTQNTLEQLAIQQQAALETIDTTIASIRAQISAVESDPNLGEEDRAAALSELSAQEQSLLGQRETTQENFNRRRAKINKNATEEETKLATESAESTAQSEKTVYDARVAELDRANQKLLDASKEAESERLTEIARIKASGVNDVEEANLGIQELESRKQVIAEELAAEQSRLAALEALPPLSDPEEEEARQAQIRQSRLKTQDLTKQGFEADEQLLQAQKRLYDAQVSMLDRANQQLLDATKAAENERLIEIAKIRASGVTDLEEASIGLQELESRKQVIAQELAVEQARLAALEALDPLSDPDDEEERQAEIRQSRLKTQDFIKEGYEIEAQLLEAQIQLIEQKLAEANRVIANETEARTQELEKQNQLLESLEKSLESQSRLLQARSDFAQTSADSISASLDAIAAGEQSEFRRQQIAQTTAAIKLQALQVQQEYELRSLELEQAQLELAKQRELAENRIAQAKAESELAIGQNEVQLAQERFSRGEISESELRGVELQQQRRQLEVEGLREQRRFIEEDLAVSREVFDLRRAGVELQQRGARRQAQAELAGTLPPGLRQRATAALADQIAQEDFGLADARQLRESGVAFARQLAGQQFNGLPATVGPQSAFDPELEGLSNVASGGALAAAQRQSGRDFRSQFGQFAVGQGASTPTAAPFQLPQELRGADLSQFQQFGGAQPAAIPERQLAVAASSRSEQREQLRELQALREAFQQQQGGGFTAEITVNADQKDLADQIGQGVRSQLEQVFNEAQRQAAVAR